MGETHAPAALNFLIAENAFGPGAHSVKFPDGEPVGVWLARERPNADPAAVIVELTALGLPVKHAEAFGNRRAIRDGHGDIESYLISQWGEEEYFASAFYLASRIESSRQKELEPLRKAYLKAKATA